MTKDLEATLSELGPEYRDVVARLRAPFAASVHRRPALPYLLAASLTLIVALSVFLLFPKSSRPAYSVYTAAYADDEYALRAILDSQRNDGSWSNDYLTMQNAAALRRAGDDASRIAYKRAVRYLRSKGLGPISEEELKSRTVLHFHGVNPPKTDGNVI